MTKHGQSCHRMKKHWNLYIAGCRSTIFLLDATFPAGCSEALQTFAQTLFTSFHQRSPEDPALEIRDVPTLELNDT